MAFTSPGLLTWLITYIWYRSVAGGMRSQNNRDWRRPLTSSVQPSTYPNHAHWPRPSVPHLHVSWTSSGMVTPPAFLDSLCQHVTTLSEKNFFLILILILMSSKHNLKCRHLLTRKIKRKKNTNQCRKVCYWGHYLNAVHLFKYKATNMIKGMQYLSYEERMRGLDSFILKRIMLRRILSMCLNWLMGRVKMELGSSHWCQITGWEVRVQV